MDYFHEHLNGKLDTTLDDFMTQFFNAEQDWKTQYGNPEAGEIGSTPPLRITPRLLYDLSGKSARVHEPVGNKICYALLGDKWDPEVLGETRANIRTGLEKGLQAFRTTYEETAQYHIGTLMMGTEIDQELHTSLEDMFETLEIDRYDRRIFIQEICDRFIEYMRAIETQQKTTSKQSKRRDEKQPKRRDQALCA